MHILLIQTDLYIVDAHSLKDKRSVLKRLLNRLRNDFNISVAEVEHHDVWQSAGLAIVAVGGIKSALERTAREVEQALESDDYVQVSGWQIEWL